MITHIEELSLNAWPSLQTLHYDGWVLRFADGYTKRANCVNPLYLSAVNVEEKIQSCEHLYRSKGLPTIFKMTSSVHPENLDAALAERGYQLDSPTSVQLLKLDRIDERKTRASTVRETLTEDWLTDFCRLSNVGRQRQTTQQQMLSNIPVQKGFFSIQHNGQAVACGMGVVQDKFVGLFDLITDANFRNRGYGRQLMHDLLAWGKEQGAQTAYLQVMLNNAPALWLYSKIGYREIYQYWYRIEKPTIG